MTKSDKCNRCKSTSLPTVNVVGKIHVCISCLDATCGGKLKLNKVIKKVKTTKKQLKK